MVGTVVLTWLALNPQGGRIIPPDDPFPRPIDAKLFAAIAKPDVARVKDLLAKGADANANEANGWRPLLQLRGTSAEQLAVARLLVAHGANVKYRQPDQGWTPLTSCAMAGNVELLRYLLSKGASLSDGMNGGETALHLASRNGNVEMVRALLAARASVSARTHPEPERVSPTSNLPYNRGWERQLAKSRAQSEREIGQSFEPGFQFSGQTPLLMAVGRGETTIAELLIRAGAKIDVSNDSGWTLAHYAAKLGDLPVLKFALKSGIDPNVATKGGFRPLHVALRGGFGVPNRSLVAFLLGAGADPKLRNAAGQTPLDLLRADFQATGYSQNSGTRTGELGAIDEEFSKAYAREANAVARLLDPNAEPLKFIPPPPAERTYEPIDLNEFELNRRLFVEGDRAILELQIPNPEVDLQLTFTRLQVNDYDPIDPLPIKLDIHKGKPVTVRIGFPAGAAIGDGIQFVYETGNRSRGSAGYGDVFGPTFRATATAEGGRAWVSNGSPKRTLEVIVDRVTISGKPIDGFPGQPISIPAGKEGAVPGLNLPKKVDGRTPTVKIRYRWRLLPNVAWTADTTSLKRPG